MEKGILNSQKWPALFSEINRELLQHLKNEEESLFPAVKEYEVRVRRSKGNNH